MRWMRALPVFSIAFPVLYVPVMYYNWPVFTYLPKLRVFHWLRFVPSPAQGVPMFYYGWLLTAGFGAAAVAGLAAALPGRPAALIPPALAWIAPLCALAVLLDILSPWFTH